MSEITDNITFRVCRNCENCSIDCTTKKAYCYDVSWLRMMLFGPRRVKPSDTCKNIVLRKESVRSR
ncbi:MAG: hypothetical protein K2M34_03595 [Alphaproteobacteria bacterium]|nr:hypothetical protein [Alphaproteobacteria bacterium]